MMVGPLASPDRMPALSLLLLKVAIFSSRLDLILRRGRTRSIAAQVSLIAFSARTIVAYQMSHETFKSSRLARRAQAASSRQRPLLDSERALNTQAQKLQIVALHSPGQGQLSEPPIHVFASNKWSRSRLPPHSAPNEEAASTC